MTRVTIIGKRMYGLRVKIDQSPPCTLNFSLDSHHGGKSERLK